ncbi:hypothetical protein [Pseudonocardia nigra]|uniref:hypothetical protein n=1 Tax=Pseudonocardia nigra TaxID=1921578 RepID=UPI001C5FAC6E|nr:hypothetical protein [Pseudonocardia nigra]
MREASAHEHAGPAHLVGHLDAAPAGRREHPPADRRYGGDGAAAGRGITGGGGHQWWTITSGRWSRAVRAAERSIARVAAAPTER